jgi:hypothetical protein
MREENELTVEYKSTHLEVYWIYFHPALAFSTIVVITEIVNKDSSNDSPTSSTQTMMDSL